MMYVADTWAVKKAQQVGCGGIEDMRSSSRPSEIGRDETLEKKLVVTEMRMLIWMNGVTKLDRKRNERFRGTPKVGEIFKVQEIRFKVVQKFKKKKMWVNSDGDGGVGKEKERMTEAEVDGQNQA